MTQVHGPVQAPGGVEGTGGVFLINHNADSALVDAALPLSASASFEAAEEPFEAAGHKFNRGSFIVRNVAGGRSRQSRQRNSACRPTRSASAPTVKTHPVRAARIAHDAHLAQHAGRRLVAPGVRPPEDSVRLHQHADGLEGRRSALEVRRDRLRAGRARESASDRQRHADVRQSAALEGNAADSESGQDRRDRRHASRAWAGAGWSICRSSCARAAC